MRALKNKKVIIPAILVALLVAAWLISPIWRDKELNEAPPTESVEIDELDSMGTDKQAQLDKEVEAMSVTSNSMNDQMSPSSTTLSSADFVPRAHDVEGKALLIESGDKKYIRFENFKTTNGPDLRVYLSAGLNNKDYVDLGAIKATEGNINYEIPAGTDTDKYSNVLVWCRSFSVLFSYAEL